MRFGMLSLATGWDAARHDVRRADVLGFDFVATGDHLRHPDDTPLTVIDGWSVLAAWAATTERIRLGMLVASVVHRHPVVLARQAVAVDVISGGRLTLGVGAGIYAVDRAMTGTPPWEPAERVARFEEYVEALVRALEGAESYEGRYYRFTGSRMSPPAVQQPRPPLVVAALGHGALRVAARHADVWSTFGGSGLDEAGLFERLGRQARTLGRHCEEVGRDPARLRRSLLVVPPLVPWHSVDGLRGFVDRAGALGFDELVVFGPGPDEVVRFEQVWGTFLSAS